jgi:hypothetical protein
MAAPRPRVPAARPSGHRRAAVPAVPAALLLAALAACAPASDAAGGAQSRASAGRTAVAAEADCLAPQVLTALGFDAAAYTGSVHRDAPEAAPVPDDFAAASVLLCSTGETLTDAAGRWAAVTASRLEGDVAPLVSALTARSTVPAGTSPSGCADGAEHADLWLVDALGGAVRVVLPGGGCGDLPDAVADGIAALDVMDVEHYPVALVAPAPTTSPTVG